jgi:hypothetical protein
MKFLSNHGKGVRWLWPVCQIHGQRICVFDATEIRAAAAGIFWLVAGSPVFGAGLSGLTPGNDDMGAY